MGDCASKLKSNSNSDSHSKAKQFICRMAKQEITILHLIFEDLADRIPEKKINIQNFSLFFHKKGQWAERLFRQFRADQPNLITHEQFINGIAKTFKTEEKAKIVLLYSFFAGSSSNVQEGIKFNDFLVMLYNYPKDGLKRILSNQQFIDHQIKDKLIQVKHQKPLFTLEKNDVQLNLRGHIECKIQQSQSESQKPQKESMGGIAEQIVAAQKVQTSFDINFQGNQIQVRTSNIKHLVKRLAKTIFQSNKINIERGKINFKQFQQWIKTHKQLYNNYYDGFHNQIWQYDPRSQFPQYILHKSQAEKLSCAKIQQQKCLMSVYLILIHSILIVCRYQQHDIPINIIVLDGLAVKQFYDSSLGFGIQINHPDGYYRKKKFHFKNQQIADQWMVFLKYYKGVTLQQNYQIGKLIGTGKFSNVYQAVNIHTGLSYAIKQIEYAKLKNQQLESIAHESSIMSVLDHPLLIYHKQTIQTKTHIYIVNELVKGNDLFELIKVQKKLNERDAANIAKQIIEGVKYMHGKGIVHLDLKPQNLMILEDDHDGNYIKIIDFGFSNYLSKIQEIKAQDLIFGTPGYIAPEILNNQHIDEKVDNFSIGAIIFFMLSGTTPFNGKTAKQICLKNKRNQYSFQSEDWKSITSTAKQLIVRLLEADPAKRISLDDALNHNWFNKRYLK